MQGLNNSFLWLLFFIALMYFLMIRPQQKQKKKRQELLNSLGKGDRIITIGGIHAKIVSLNDEENTMVVEIAPNVRITMQRSAVGVMADEENAAAKTPASKKDDTSEHENAEE